MTIVRPIVRRLGILAASATLGVATMASVGAQTAMASGCTLNISARTPQGNYEVGIFCGDGVSVSDFTLYGSDAFFDDYRGAFSGPGATVPRSVLNEDDSWFDRGDEIYALVGGTDQFSHPFSGVKTQVVYRSF